MPLLTTEAVVGFKAFFEFAAATYRDPVFSPDAVPTPDRPYWEQGAAQCEACGWRITAGCVAHCMTCGGVDICAACMGSRLHAHGPHFHAPGHMWTLFVLATGACGYANVDNAPTFGSSVPASGKHKFLGTGFYVQGPDRTAMTLEIKFDGSKVKGRGVDAIGGFKIRGERQLETNRVCFEKRYESHTIEYDATLVDGAMLVGSWNFQHQDSGPFVLVLEAKKESFEVVEKAKWSGHYVQNATHFPTSMKLSILSTGRIEGSGRDDVGEYLISGRFLENGTITGPFLFTKKYETHAISYDGVRQGSVMTGTYQSPGTGRDAFMLQMTYQ